MTLPAITNVENYNLGLVASGPYSYLKRMQDGDHWKSTVVAPRRACMAANVAAFSGEHGYYRVVAWTPEEVAELQALSARR